MIYCIVGIGNLGASIAHHLILMAQPGTEVLLYEPYEPAKIRALGEYYDLLPVAHHRGITLEYRDEPPAEPAVCVVTCGRPRPDPSVTKAELYDMNLPLVKHALKGLNPTALYIATNPPVELAAVVGGTPLRACTDDLRAACGDATTLNNAALSRKGHTAFTPGYAIAREVLR
jgi:malate/lactate dehydrogenase